MALAGRVLLLLSWAPASLGSMFLGRRGPPARAALAAAPKADRQVCAGLVNRGTHSTVDVEVGTPGQKFSVVADTGSNTLIVPSCVCQQAGYCSRQDRCFTGTNRSTTFALLKEGGQMLALVLTFGSGEIEGVIAREQVKVGGLRAFMDRGLLLMTAKALDFGGSFEGILGLGIPSTSGAPRPEPAWKERAVQPAAGGAAWHQAKGRVVGRPGNRTGASAGARGWPSAFDAPWEDGRPLSVAARPGKHFSGPPSFLEQAGVSSFSICFNDGSDGVLRLGMPADGSVPRHASVGTAHWGLGLDGISVAGRGVEPVRVELCSRGDMLPGQETPCGAIPDSGTTMITGPAEGVAQLLDSLCDQWPRCRQNYTALQRATEAAERAAAAEYGFSPFALEAGPKHRILELLLMDCESWLGGPDGLAELPSLHFHVGGAAGTRQTLEMPGHAYVIERTVQVLSGTEADLGKGIRRRKVCAPAFTPLEYRTQKNGPVWILGTPFFYEFTVGYDLGTRPPSLSLRPTRQAPCGHCSEQLGLLGAGAEKAGADAAPRQRGPLPMEGEPRGPSFDVGEPL